MDVFDIIFDDDDDEEIVQYLNRPRATRIIEPRTNLFDTLTDKKFIRRFRLKKPTVLLLLQEIEHNLKFSTQKNYAVSPMNQLLCTLRYYATGSQLITCGDIIGVEEATACRIVQRVTHAIALLYKKYIALPESHQDLQDLAKHFYKIAKFPRVVGAIDCTHVRILSPGGPNAEIYRNRKGYFSINTQCIAAPDLSFMDVVARWHGSAHDSNIWDNCSIKRNFLRGKYNDKLLLGDSGYAQKSFMMIPLPEGSVHTRGEALYQESQIKTRNVVERAFGVWKRRFPIISRGISVNLSRVPGVIIATAVLHNIAIWQKEEVPPEDPEYPVLPEPSESQHRVPSVTRGRDGRNFERTVLINNYFSRL